MLQCFIYKAENVANTVYFISDSNDVAIIYVTIFKLWYDKSATQNNLYLL